MKKFWRTDSFKYGLILAVVVPVVLFAIVFLVKFHGYERPFANPLILVQLPKLFSLCVFPNGLIFYYYINRDSLLTMRGMVTGTVIMGLIMLVMYAFC